MKRGDVGKALMMVGGCLAVTLLAAFLATAYVEGGSPTKLARMFVAELAIVSVFLVGYHFRFVSAKRTRAQQQRKKS